MTMFLFMILATHWIHLPPYHPVGPEPVRGHPITIIPASSREARP